VEEGAESGGGLRVGLAVGVFEDEMALVALEFVCGIFAIAGSISSVAVEMEHVIVTGVGAEVLAKLIEGGRAEDVDMGWETPGADEFDKRPGDGAVTDVGFVGPGDDEEDVDAVLGELGELGRFGEAVQAALDLAVMGDEVGLGIEEGFPGPGEDAGVIATDLENCGSLEPIGGVAAIEEGVEGLGAPGLEGVKDAIGVAGFGRERVIEEAFEVPAKLAHEVGGGLAGDGEIVRRGDGDGRGGFAVGEAGEDEARRPGAFDVGNRKGGEGGRGGHAWIILSFRETDACKGRRLGI